MMSSFIFLKSFFSDFLSGTLVLFRSCTLPARGGGGEERCGRRHSSGDTDHWLVKNSTIGTSLTICYEI